MSQNDAAVITAAVGYVYIAEPGTARPVPYMVELLDGSYYDAQTNIVRPSAEPTGGTFTFAVGVIAKDEPAANLVGVDVQPEVVPEGAVESVDTLPAEEAGVAPKSKTAKADKSAVEPAAGALVTPPIKFSATHLEIQAALEALVGVGNVKCTSSLRAGLVVSWVGELHGKTVNFTANSQLTGASGAVTLTVSAPYAAGVWTSVGHTSRGDLPEFGYDGGDTEVRGTWQNESLREVTTKPIADFLTIFLQQFDIQSFELYYGKDANPTSGVFGVAGGNPVPVEKALFIVIVDGDTKIGFYAPKASIRRDDSVQLAVDEFASLPVRATFLKYGAANKFEWISQELLIP